MAKPLLTCVIAIFIPDFPLGAQCLQMFPIIITDNPLQSQHKYNIRHLTEMRVTRSSLTYETKFIKSVSNCNTINLIKIVPWNRTANDNIKKSDGQQSAKHKMCLGP